MCHNALISVTPRLWGSAWQIAAAVFGAANATPNTQGRYDDLQEIATEHQASFDEHIFRAIWDDDMSSADYLVSLRELSLLTRRDLLSDLWTDHVEQLQRDTDGQDTDEEERLQDDQYTALELFDRYQVMWLPRRSKPPKPGGMPRNAMSDEYYLLRAREKD